nr:phosphoesterase [uncultured archaeon]
MKHVFIIFKENRSFDNLFGVYPYGHDRVLENNSIVKELSIPDGVLSGKVSVPNYPGIPFLGSTPLTYANSPVQQNPGEGWVDYHGDWDYGRMDGFVAYSGSQAMVYLDYIQIPFYWDYAEEYVLCDNYFTAIMSQSQPNWFAVWSGTTVVSNDVSPPPYLPLNHTIFYQLTQYNISWAVVGLFSQPVGAGGSEIGYLDYISGFNSPQYLQHVINFSVFYQMLRNGSVPSFVFIDDYGLASGVSEHPPDNITYSEMWTVNVVNAIETSKVWNSSAIFITWDDEGGFYDHVPPPEVNSLGLGLRTACLIISPYAKEDYIDHQVLSHYSLLKFVEWNWNLPYINRAVADANLPLDAFNFDQPPRPPIVLGPTPDIEGTIGAPYGYIVFENGSIYRLSAVQTSQQYPIPLQIPISQLSYSVPQNYSGNIGFTPVYTYSVPPPWTNMAEFFTVLIGLILFVSGFYTRASYRGKLLLLVSIFVSIVPVVLSTVYPPVPPAPVPPNESAISIFGMLGGVFAVLAILILASPYLSRRRRPVS